jgi:hypothetical protein
MEQWRSGYFPEDELSVGFLTVALVRGNVDFEQLSPLAQRLRPTILTDDSRPGAGCPGNARRR